MAPKLFLAIWFDVLAYFALEIGHPLSPSDQPLAPVPLAQFSTDF